MKRLVAVVGLIGSGKSTVSDILKEQGFAVVHFGDITRDILSEQGLAFSEANERPLRTQLREEHGMAAYAKLNLPKVREQLKKGPVCIDDLMSWSEYLLVKEEFPHLIVVAVHASPKTRYERLEKRLVRPLTNQEAKSRDKHQIGSLEQGGPIAYADYHLVNEGTLSELKKGAGELLKALSQE
jgi:dephospho-CoA kinase